MAEFSLASRKKAKAKLTQHDDESAYHNDHPKEEQSESEGESWLISYADMMTLLCGFFIILFSMSKLEETKYDKFKQVIAKQFGGEYKSPTQELSKFVTNVINEAGLDQKVNVYTDPLGLAATFQSTILFDTLSSGASQDGQIILTKLADAVKSFEQVNSLKTKIVVEGHTDGRPVASGPWASNWELAASRAIEVVKLFHSRGFDPSVTSAISYGDTRPIEPEVNPDGSVNEDGQSKNRRVVVRVLMPTVDGIPMPENTAH